MLLRIFCLIEGYRNWQRAAIPVGFQLCRHALGVCVMASAQRRDDLSPPVDADQRHVLLGEPRNNVE